MSQKHNIKIANVKWDRYGETSETFIDEKQTLTPCFVAHVKNALEFAIYRDERINNGSLAQSNVCFMPYHLGSKTAQPLFQSIDQRTLTGQYAYRPFLENTVFGYDPCTEAMVLSGRYEEIISSQETPKEILEYFKKIIRRRKTGKIDNISQMMREENASFWKQIEKDTKSRNNMILTDFENAKKNGANFYLIRSPFIDSSESFEMWQRFDSFGKSLGYDGVVSTYIPCNSTILYDNKLVKQIIDYITEDPTELTIFKFKNLNLTDLNKHTEFDNFKLLLEQINSIKRGHDNKSFMILESYYQTYPSAIGGFDYVSTSLRGNDADYVRSGKPEEQFHGWWFHPKKLINYRRTEVVEMSKDNGLPCNCVYCTNIPDVSAVTKEYWNTYRRQHALLNWSKLMQNMRNMILESRVEDATEEVLEHSRLKLFKELIPPY